MCVNRYPGRTILMNYEVVDFQASVSDCSILRLCRLLLTLLIYPFHPTIYFTFSGSFIPFLPPPGPILYHPHISFINATSLSLCTHFYPPPLSRSRSDCPTVRRSCPPAATARLRFPPMPGGSKEFLALVVPDYPCLFAPPCRT